MLPRSIRDGPRQGPDAQFLVDRIDHLGVDLQQVAAGPGRQRQVG